MTRPVDRILNDTVTAQALTAIAADITDPTRCAIALSVVRSLVTFAYQEGRADGMQALIERTTTTPEKA